jgi:hypothetical protein
MGIWLPWAFLVFVAILLMAMPWRRPHPNHEFIFDMLRLLEEEDSDAANPSSSTGNRANVIASSSPSPSTYTPEHRSSVLASGGWN